MTLHWTIIRTGTSDICKNGWYLLLRRTIR